MWLFFIILAPEVGPTSYETPCIFLAGYTHIRVESEKFVSFPNYPRPSIFKNNIQRDWIWCFFLSSFFSIKQRIERNLNVSGREKSIESESWEVSVTELWKYYGSSVTSVRVMCVIQYSYDTALYAASFLRTSVWHETECLNCRRPLSVDPLWIF